MKKQFPLGLLCLLFGISLSAQSDYLKVNPSTRLLKDSIESNLLVSNINDFLLTSQKPNIENDWVLSAQKVETYILLDEVQGMPKSGKYKDENFYKPYLTNVMKVDEKQYLIQVSYIGVHGSVPTLRASFTFIAHRQSDRYLFSSPLIRNTDSWKAVKRAGCTFYCKQRVNEDNVDAYEKAIKVYDGKLKSDAKMTTIYGMRDRTELLQMMGVDYKLDINGKSYSGAYSSVDHGNQLLLDSENPSFDKFDTHDLWHDRLSLVISRRLVNKPIDEGCAYIYAGSWGISWEDILALFKERVASDKSSDWASFKENPFNFNDTQAEHLYVDYVVNALIIQQMEKEHGFQAVWEFLNCGKYEKGNEKYYEVLEKWSGITKAKYNESVWKLINEF